MTLTETERAQIEQAMPMAHSGRSRHGYYRQPNGWITVSPMTELDELKYRREGWDALRVYGFVEMNTEYAADHPFEALFMFGGAHEMPEEQVIGMGFHLNPPLVPSCGRRLDQNHKWHNASCWVGAQPVTFPQVTDPPDGEQCRFCDRLPFPTEQARDQHEGVMHKEEKGEIRTGKVLGDTIVHGLTGTLEGTPEEPRGERLPFACGLCPKSYRYLGHLKNHVKDEHS